jgi:hypothetical protein
MPAVGARHGVAVLQHAASSDGHGFLALTEVSGSPDESLEKEALHFILEAADLHHPPIEERRP